jgi:dextranase
MNHRHNALLLSLFLGAALIAGAGTAAGGASLASIETDRSRYAPGDTVRVTVTLDSPLDSAVVTVRWMHLDGVVGEKSVPVLHAAAVTFSWIPPAADYRGYLADIRVTLGTALLDRGTIAVDVSSDWKRFPRYGFLSSYQLMNEAAIDNVVKKLNRYHINGLQFYDWHYKHHMPLKGTPENPASQWNDIANRTNYFYTVNGYIQAAHRYGMQAMAYNLLYGAYADAGTDGVQVNEWGLYKDANHATRYFYHLPAGWASDLYFMDPSNEQWKSYLYAQEKKVFQALPFDGWHVDQVGDPGAVYTYTGQRVRDADYFRSFLTDAKKALNVRLVMNAVNQYGQTGIAQAPVDFLYTEVWDPTTTYGGLKTLTEYYGVYQGGPLNMVIAAYMDYGLANAKTMFNTPGVLFTDAVIFASGGAHLELGEHMLVHEYFPNNNVAMKPDLERRLTSYYDFSVAYQNLLRDSVAPAAASFIADDATTLSKTDLKGSIWYFSRMKGNTQIVHFINFLDAAHLLWRDNMGTQTEPSARGSVPLTFAVDRAVKKIWMATPDSLGGGAIDLPFTQSADRASFVLPYIKYWDMIVIEYVDVPTSIRREGSMNHGGSLRPHSYPSPFNGAVTIGYTLPADANVSLRIYDTLGREVSTYVPDHAAAGDHRYEWDAAGHASGMYFYRITASPHTGSSTPLVASGKLLLTK